MAEAHVHSSDCVEEGFALEVHWCSVQDLWVATVHEVPRQLNLFADDLPAAQASADGVWTAAKAALRQYLASHASMRAAEARANLRRSGFEKT